MMLLDGLLNRISIHAPRVGSDIGDGILGLVCRISIHAPRVGSDCVDEDGQLEPPISIHAPRVGSDPGSSPTLSSPR